MLEKLIRKLAAQHSTPLAIIRRSALAEAVERFRRALPRVEPFYAVKCNPDPNVIKTFAELGLGFDVASRAEMEAVLGLGVKPERIVFSHTVKRIEDLEFARSKGVSLTAYDTEYELAKIARHHPEARVLLRIKVPNAGSVVELSRKFGAEVPDAIPLLFRAKDMGLDVAGICFHVGSQCTNPDNFVEAAEIARLILHDAQLKGLTLSILDIGGGFPIRMSEGSNGADIESIAAVLRGELDRVIPPNVRLIAEPGRALAGPAMTLVMRVIGKAIRFNKNWYFLDDGLYGGLSGIVFDHSRYEFKTFRKGQKLISTLAGPTCDSFDVIESSALLPELKVGDIVYVENAGAYSLASATSFNGMPRPKVVFVP